MGAGDGHVCRFGPRWSVVPAWLRHGVVIFLVLLVVEYLVIPELVGASKDLDLLGELNVGWLIAGIVLEAGSPFCYAMLTRSLLLGGRPGLSRLVRIVMSTTAVAHVMPGGAAGGAGLGYQLLTSNGVDGPDAGWRGPGHNAAHCLAAGFWDTSPER